MMSDNPAIESAPDTLRDVDDDALEEQLAHIAAIFDLPYDDLVAALRR